MDKIIIMGKIIRLAAAITAVDTLPEFGMTLH
jgi:hypothetical protein